MNLLLPPVTPNAHGKEGDADRGVGKGVSLSLKAAPLIAKFPLSCDSKIYLSLFGEVITCDLKTLGPDPAVIIQLLKTTQSERANYMIVGASYRRSGFPQCAKAIIETMIQELGKRGVSESDLKPAYLFLAGCESDLVKLSKATKNSTVVSEHYAAAQLWLQKVFGKADELESSSLKGVASSDSKVNIGRLMREIQILRDQNAQQVTQLAQLQSSKRKIEDDYYYERNLRKKYQNRMESVKERVMYC